MALRFRRTEGRDGVGNLCHDHWRNRPGPDARAQRLRERLNPNAVDISGTDGWELAGLPEYSAIYLSNGGLSFFSAWELIWHDVLPLDAESLPRQNPCQ